MKNLIVSENLTMSSREIAELTGKQHKNVMADCRSLLSEYEKLYENQTAEISALVKSGTYKDKNGENQPCFILNRQASLDLVTGYSLPHRHAVNKRWMELEEKQAHQPDPIAVLNDPAAMRGLLLTYSEKVLALQSTVEEQAPMVAAMNRLSASEGSVSITEAAKMLGRPPKKLFAFLQQRGWVYRRPGGKSWLAYQHVMVAGYLEHEPYIYTKNDGSEHCRDAVKVTPKGMTRLACLLDKEVA